MKHTYFIALTALSLSLTNMCFAQTTETFETETTGSTTFTDNGQGFIITNGPGETTYDIEFFSGGGWNGSSGDDKFIDNSGGSPSQNDGSSFIITTSDGADITIKSLYLFVAKRNLTTGVSTTLTFTGKNGGSTVFTINKSSGIVDGANFTPNNGFTFIDFSTEGGSDNSNIAVDELIVSSTNNGDYMALDAFRWAEALVPTWDGSTSTDWNVSSNWNTNAVPTATDNVIIPSAPSNQPHVTLAPGTPAVCADLTVQSGATLTIDAGKALTVNGTLANAGTVDIKATSSGIGSLITNGTISGAGSFKAEQYLTGSGGATPNGLFYYVSSPIPNATAANYNIASGNKLWIDDEPNQTYPQLTFGAIPLEVGQGYVARMGSTGSITFDGSSFNTGNQSEAGLTRTGTTELNRGYNLVGNPYPSTVNWNTASKTNLETSIWFRTHDGGGSMLFDTYNTTGNVGTNNNGGGDVTSLIPPTQAFWVRVNADGNTGQLDFDNADRSHGAWSGLYKAEAQEGMVRMALSDGNASDEAIVMFDALAQDNFDDYDSHKFWAAGIPQLYMTESVDTIVINGLYSTVTNPTVPLGVKLPTQGNYTLNASSITVVGETVHLEDTYLNIFQDLNVEPSYAFTSDTGNIGDRFVLHFGMASVGIEDGIQASSRVYASNGNQLNIILSENTENGNVQVLDMAGRVVYTTSLNASRNTINLNTSTGVYLVRVETAKGTDTHRILFN